MMKKISFMLDENTDKILKTIARCEDMTKSDVLRKIVRKEAKQMAYRMGFLPKDEIKQFINK